jgi:hypothetical protein
LDHLTCESAAYRTASLQERDAKTQTRITPKADANHVPPAQDDQSDAAGVTAAVAQLERRNDGKTMELWKK